MKTEIYYCDKCKQQIFDIVYTLSCNAATVGNPPVAAMRKAAEQNIHQSASSQIGEKHLCAQCKDALTDGIFIV